VWCDGRYAVKNVFDSGTSPDALTYFLRFSRPAANRSIEVMTRFADLPADFLWGVATSAYQIEGAVREDGRGPSIWDTFAARPRTIAGGDTAAVACDFYHRHREDVRLARRLGVDAFRFSIAWPRVLPDGRGKVNTAGLDFYDRLVDELLAAGLQPFVTLFHWDLPQPLEDAGGWPDRATAEAFAGYAAVVAARLGDRVRLWTTHNEPYCAGWMGYVTGQFAPGRTNLTAGLAAVHHLLLGHGLAVAAIRAAAPAAQVGIVLDSWPQHPATDDPRDRAAARAADGLRNRLFFDAVLRGRYPADVLERLAPVAPPVRDGDAATIAAKLDFLGINNYSRNVIRGPTVVRPHGPLTAMGWEIRPQGLYEVLMRLHREYDAPPLIVSETGAAFADGVRADGTIDDRARIAYLDGYLDALLAAVRDGAPVRGHFVWSLLDNFEWTQGFARRFGLVHVNYATLARTPKASFDWYRKTIAQARVTSARAAAARTPAASAYRGA
jgi:beta-glucosidase